MTNTKAISCDAADTGASVVAANGKFAADTGASVVAANGRSAADTGTVSTEGKKRHTLSLLLLMASITLMAVLCELVPSGVLPLMAKHFAISEAKAGILVGGYAVASAICGIPLVSLTVEWPRKRLLFILIIGFAVSNIIVSFAPGFTVAILGRILGGICAGTLWPMITAYGMAFVEQRHQGRAVTIIMSGITVGMALGLPFMTKIGTLFGFQAEFLLLGILLVIIAVLCRIFLPSVAGEKRSQANSPLTMLKNRGVLLVILLTFLAVGVNYGLYTFITNLVAVTGYPGITTAQLLFGIGSVISIILAIRYIDRYLPEIVLALFLVGVIAMLTLYFAGSVYVLHLAFVLWGLGFGSLSSVFQAATARQVREGTAVANALQSSSFNFSIMIGSSVGGVLLGQKGAMAIVLLTVGVLAFGGVVSGLTRRQLSGLQ